MQKSQALFAYLETNRYICTHNQKMYGGKRIIHVILSNEAEGFVKLQPLKVQQKIAYNIRKLESGVMDKELFKKLENSEIWELRTLINGVCYRLFSFWDTEINALVVVTHGIVKKTRKTPKKEIEKAESIRKEYFNDKNT